MPNFAAEAREYNLTYNADWEDEAQIQRGLFLDMFPVNSLAKLTLENYAIGHGKKTFCHWLEPGTRKWAAIAGSPADKFGIYFGKTKSDPTPRYRYVKKFSHDLPSEGAEREAFSRVRQALLSLMKDGEALDFDAIDANPLSQMVKAKTLSLYYPHKYLPLCSADTLRDLAPKLGLDDRSPSQIQHEALAVQAKSAGVRAWTPLKFTAFLYEMVLRNGPIYGDWQGKPKAKAEKKANKERTPDFEKLMKLWAELGQKSEQFALAHEKARLRSLGHDALATMIKDRTKQPAYGYDFESFSEPGQPRYIEVKTFTPLNGDVSRFFLSHHEHATASSPKMHEHYYFYLVMYGPNREPIDCQVRSARQVLKEGTLQASSYLVRLSRHHAE